MCPSYIRIGPFLLLLDTHLHVHSNYSENTSRCTSCYVPTEVTYNILLYHFFCNYEHSILTQAWSQRGPGLELLADQGALFCPAFTPTTYLAQMCATGQADWPRAECKPTRGSGRTLQFHLQPREGLQHPSDPKGEHTAQPFHLLLQGHEHGWL